MIDLYTYPTSPCSQKVRIVLEEKQLPWKKVHVELPEKENLKPEYLALNPLGVVPTLVNGEDVVIESSIICEYLDDSYPEPPLRPKDPFLLSRMRLQMKHVDNNVHPSCGVLQWPLVMEKKIAQMTEEELEKMVNRVVEKPRRERQKRLIKYGYEAPDVVDAVATYEKTIQNMDKTLESHAWLAGDTFSLADACTAPYFQTLAQFGWTEWYASRERVSDWFSRCQQRASYEGGVLADFPEEQLAEFKIQGKPVWETIQKHLKQLRSS